MTEHETARVRRGRGEHDVKKDASHFVLSGEEKTAKLRAYMQYTRRRVFA